MSGWNALRRARDNIKPKRPISLCPEILGTILDEIVAMKKEIRDLKRKKNA